MTTENKLSKAVLMSTWHHIRRLYLRLNNLGVVSDKLFLKISYHTSNRCFTVTKSYLISKSKNKEIFIYSEEIVPIMWIERQKEALSHPAMQNENIQA